MSDLSEFTYGCNNPHCNCRYDSRVDWPINNRRQNSLISNGLNRKKSVLQVQVQVQGLEEMAVNKESILDSRKDDALVTRLEEVAAGRRWVSLLVCIT